MRSEYVDPTIMRLIMAHMQTDNALALEISLQTGLRIDDVLSLRKDNLKGRTLTLCEKKTGKKAVKTITQATAERLRRNSKSDLFFPSLRSAHRTRQTVYTDLKKTARRLGFAEHISPHSARKSYAVGIYQKDGLNAAQAALNHDNTATTIIYALSDKMKDNAQNAKHFDNNRDFFAEIQEINEKLDKILNLLLEQKRGL